MNEHTAAILGVWAFAVGTSISSRVAGWFMLVSYLVAGAVTFVLLK